ncbi:MAG: insulinase family protein [Boseongicola sp. SB0677_bin_26]|nr:insulinase family protein [Boseongicola sp. SB0665_bin_10]MYG24680.1 insulinase family protein [Boseongicola sp. SB0677_bin_26]
MNRFICALGLAIVVAGPAAAVDIQEVTSPGGIKAWLVEERSIPFSALEIRFRGGGSLDRPGKRGAVNLMTALLEEGAGDLDAQGFAAARDALAASYGFDVHRDALSVSARFLTENRDEAVALLRSALTAPRFDQDALDRVRDQVLAVIRADDTDPATVASRRFNALAFGDHPYATSIDGTVESVSALTRDDIVTAYKDVIARDRIFVGAAGDISAEELGLLIDTLLAGLPEVGAPLPNDSEVLLVGGVTVVPFETPQSVAIFGHAGIPRDDPEFFPAFVASHVFGASGRQSRLGMEVREKRGLTYGIGAYLASFDLAQLVVGQVASANERIAEAIEVTRDEWAKMAAEGVTEEELDAAKAYLTGAYPLRFDSNASIARIMVGMQMDDLGLDYVNTRNGKVNAVTTDDVRRVASRLYLPEELHFVVVGRPEGIEGTN